MAICFYSDFTDLPAAMKRACRRNSPDETDESVMERHCEVVNWTKLLFECIMVYGQPFTRKSKSVYHGLDMKFMFHEFKARYYTDD